MMKRKSRQILALLLSVSLLSACAAQNTEDAGDAPEISFETNDGLFEEERLQLIAVLGIRCCFNLGGEDCKNPYFFNSGQTIVEYRGFFYPLSYKEIWQNINLNINRIGGFENGILYTLELDQLDVTDPMDEIRMGGRYLGYFYVTDESIYYMRLPDMEGFSDEKNKKVIEMLQEDEGAFLERCSLVCCENGTKDIPDENGWHEYVEVVGEKRIFHLYNDYTGGTKEYGQMVWEREKGLTYYQHGSGSMIMHIEFWLEE